VRGIVGIDHTVFEPTFDIAHEVADAFAKSHESRPPSLSSPLSQRRWRYSKLLTQFTFGKCKSLYIRLHKASYAQVAHYGWF